MPSTALSTESLSIDDPKSLRAELRRVMPPEAFEPQPQRGVAALALVPVNLGLMGLLGWGDLPWWLCLPLSLLLGQTVTSVGLAAHEALHHSVFRSRRWEEVLGWAGFGLFLVTPGTWRAWHVQAHHSAANVHQRDPDILPRQQDLSTQWFARLFHAISPGSGTWVSYISFFLFFTAQGQAFLWHHIRQPQLRHVRMNLVKERVLTVLVAAGWLALGFAMGPRGALFALVIPHLVGNFTLMIYIATNHWLRPASEDSDNPFVSTASVETHPLMNWAHFNFSYHQEHHIFPSMSHRFGPLLRQRLRELKPEASAVFPHVRALRALYSRPALYSPTDGTVLVGRDGTPAVSTEELRRRLDAPGQAMS